MVDSPTKKPKPPPVMPSLPPPPTFKPPLPAERAVSPSPTSKTLFNNPFLAQSPTRAESPTRRPLISQSTMRRSATPDISQSIEDSRNDMTDLVARTLGGYPRPKGSEQEFSEQDEDGDETGAGAILPDDTIHHIDTNPREPQILPRGFDIGFCLDWKLDDGIWYPKDSEATTLDPFADFRFNTVQSLTEGLQGPHGAFFFSLLRGLVHRHAQLMKGSLSSKATNKDLKAANKLLTTTLKDLENKFEDQNLLLVDLQNEVNDLRKEKKDLINATNQWQDRYDRKKELIESLQSRVKDAESAVVDARTALKRETDMLNNMRTMNEQMRARQALGDAPPERGNLPDQDNLPTGRDKRKARRSKHARLPTGAAPPPDSDPSSSSSDEGREPDPGRDLPHRRHREREPSHASQTTATTQTSSRYRMKVSDPPEFNGDRKTYGFWKSKMIHKIKSEKAYFEQEDHPEHERIEYIASRLGLDAHATVKHRLPSHAPAHKCFKTAADLWDYMDQLYEDPDEKETAAVEFDGFRQGSDQAFDVFYAEFSRLINHLDMTEDTKISYLKKKVNKRIRDRINNGIEVHSLSQLVDKCRSMERAILAQDRDENRSSRKTVSFKGKKTFTAVRDTPTSTTMTTSTSVNRVPQLDAATRKKLREENRCFGCKRVGCRTDKPDCPMYRFRTQQETIARRANANVAKIHALALSPSDDEDADESSLDDESLSQGEESSPVTDSEN
ncbi:hypothetical protein LTR06_002116 [Exophiala xenobiotica]|nr:hypothetical protein LTR06_002116 [Exophiala xenobiotica]